MAAPKWDIQDSFPAPLLRVVAQITIAAGQLDWVLMLAYKRARGEEMKVGMLAAEELRDFKKLKKETQKYLNEKITDPEVQQELSKILDRAWDAYQKRHTVIHAVFAIQDGELKRFYTDKPLIKVKGKNYGVDVKELRAIRDRLRASRDELHFFTKKYLLGKKKPNADT